VNTHFPATSTSPIPQAHDGRRRAYLRSWITAATCAGVLLVLNRGCDMPRDPQQTMQGIRQRGAIRVGVSESPPWTRAADTQPQGTEPDLIRRFAQSMQARVQWHAGGESELLARLEKHELDLVIGGLTADSPWKTRVALTRPYLREPGRGKAGEHVMAVMRGENGFLVHLERFLHHHQPPAPPPEPGS
jgi:ABC-type amino acid transport substrate-binding protein